MEKASRINLDVLAELVGDIGGRLSQCHVSSDVRAAISDNADAIHQELLKEKPITGFVRIAMAGLNAALPTIRDEALRAAVSRLVQFGQSSLQKIAP
jgi:hypothetical protein